MPKLDSVTGYNYRNVMFDTIKRYRIPTAVTEVNPKIEQPQPTGTTSIHFADTDVISAIIAEHKANPSAKIAVLNFASFKRPGGGFMSDMLAQEEALCYCTSLYPALVEHKDDWYTPHERVLHNGMYENQALLSHGVTVLAYKLGYLLRQEHMFTVDVLTCAAPNWTNGLKYGSLTLEEMQNATKDRINYVMSILASRDYDVLILGAFGCGVFKNDPEVVANAFKKEILCNYVGFINKVVFAIPVERRNNNNQVFKTVFNTPALL